jgi:transposase
LDKEIRANERQLRQLVSGLMPTLLGEPGVGPISAAHLIVAWSHPAGADPKPNSPPLLVA